MVAVAFLVLTVNKLSNFDMAAIWASATRTCHPEILKQSALQHETGGGLHRCDGRAIKMVQENSFQGRGRGLYEGRENLLATRFGNRNAKRLEAPRVGLDQTSKVFIRHAHLQPSLCYAEVLDIWTSGRDHRQSLPEPLKVNVFIIIIVASSEVSQVGRVPEDWMVNPRLASPQATSHNEAPQGLEAPPLVLLLRLSHYCSKLSGFLRTVESLTKTTDAQLVESRRAVLENSQDRERVWRFAGPKGQLCQ
ncbi:MAG: hypothetical protein JOS17DRAFT_749318, partial [Linnemannia elongata]